MGIRGGFISSSLLHWGYNSPETQLYPEIVLIIRPYSGNTLDSSPVYWLQEPLEWKCKFITLANTLEVKTSSAHWQRSLSAHFHLAFGFWGLLACFYFNDCLFYSALLLFPEKGKSGDLIHCIARNGTPYHPSSSETFGISVPYSPWYVPEGAGVSTSFVCLGFSFF